MQAKQVDFDKEALATYEQAYHEFAEKLSVTDDIKYRIRDLIFAIADACCPLNYYKDNPMNQKTLCYLIGESNSKEQAVSNRVREELFRRCARLGILQSVKSQLKIKLAIPKPEEFTEINKLRLYTEFQVFLAVHEMDVNEKRDAIDKLRSANEAIPDKQYDSIELKTRLKCEPEFGHKAEIFWKKDAKFHVLLATDFGGTIREDLLWLLLERIRLTRSNRLTIITRIPESKKEHAAIIDAVEAYYIEGRTPNKIYDALKTHLLKSNTAFGIETKLKGSLE